MLRQEDCNEASLGAGILTLTDRRLVFDKTKGRIIDFSMRMSDTALDIPLKEITKVWKEGWITRSIYIMTGGKTYGFGVFRAGAWTDAIQDAIDRL